MENPWDEIYMNLFVILIVGTMTFVMSDVIMVTTKRPSRNTQRCLAVMQAAALTIVLYLLYFSWLIYSTFIDKENRETT